MELASDWSRVPSSARLDGNTINIVVEHLHVVSSIADIGDDITGENMHGSIVRTISSKCQPAYPTQTVGGRGGGQAYGTLHTANQSSAFAFEI